MPHPEPDHGVFVFHGKCSVMQTDPGGPEPPNLLEAQGRMLRVAPRWSIGSVGEEAYVFRKLAVAIPEPGIGAVPHRSVQRPARRSSRASSASASSRPDATSSSIRRSHASASNSANHARNAASSAAGSLRTASSISFTLLINYSLLCTVAHAQRCSCSAGVAAGSIQQEQLLNRALGNWPDTAIWEAWPCRHYVSGIATSFLSECMTASARAPLLPRQRNRQRPHGAAPAIVNQHAQFLHALR